VFPLTPIVTCLPEQPVNVRVAPPPPTLCEHVPEESSSSIAVKEQLAVWFGPMGSGPHVVLFPPAYGFAFTPLAAPLADAVLAGLDVSVTVSAAVKLPSALTVQAAVDAPPDAHPDQLYP
jgi:hypothetical protein